MLLTSDEKKRLYSFIISSDSQDHIYNLTTFQCLSTLNWWLVCCRLLPTLRYHNKLCSANTCSAVSNTSTMKQDRATECHPPVSDLVFCLQDHSTTVSHHLPNNGIEWDVQNAADHGITKAGFHATAYQAKAKDPIFSAQKNHSTTVSRRLLNVGAEWYAQNAAEHRTIRSNYGVISYQAKVKGLIFNAQNHSTMTSCHVPNSGTKSDAQYAADSRTTKRGFHATAYQAKVGALIFSVQKNHSSTMSRCLPNAGAKWHAQNAADHKTIKCNYGVSAYQAKVGALIFSAQKITASTDTPHIGGTVTYVQLLHGAILLYIVKDAVSDEAVTWSTMQLRTTVQSADLS